MEMSSTMKCPSCRCECACVPQPSILPTQCQKHGSTTLYCADCVTSWTQHSQPSREALEKILFPHAKPQVPSLQENWLIEKVMAWATGQRERTWCEEISWNPNTRQWHFKPYLDSEQELLVMKRWMTCPICAAKRPSEQD